MTGIVFDVDAERWVTDDEYRSTLDSFTLEQAMKVAEYYGGGEFDDESADIVSALCTLRDFIQGKFPETFHPELQYEEDES